jgi:hypothetical protein
VHSASNTSPYSLYDTCCFTFDICSSVVVAVVMCEQRIINHTYRSQLLDLLPLFSASRQVHSTSQRREIISVGRIMMKDTWNVQAVEQRLTCPTILFYMHTLSMLFVYFVLQLVVLVSNEQYALYDNVSLLSSLLQHAVVCSCSG